MGALAWDAALISKRTERLGKYTQWEHDENGRERKGWEGSATDEKEGARKLT